MKKIDLHIHTVSSVSDREFEFDVEILKKYVNESRLDIISITNHNLFDNDNYELISQYLDIPVYPGVEVDIDGCHILVISPVTQKEIFKGQCDKLRRAITTAEDQISFEEFEEIFANYCDYLIIPHYENKKPAISQKLLDKFGDKVTCGEVSNPKRFSICKKNDECLTPVMFSDFRVEKDVKVFPNTGTFVDIEDINFNNIKLSLSDKNRVYIEESKADEEFVIHGNINASVGLNLIVGRRSSGKTHLLDSINKSYVDSNVKYIHQFSIVQKAEEKTFVTALAKDNSITTESYLKELGTLITSYKDIDLMKENQLLTDYASTLKSYAEEQDLEDIFSSAKLFNEDYFSNLELDSISTLLSSIQNIIDNTEYKDLIEEFIERDKLLELLKKVVVKLKTQKMSIKAKHIANEIIKVTKGKLDLGSARTQVTGIDFISIAKNSLRIQRFDEVVELLLQEDYVNSLEENPGRFTRKVKRRKYTSANDIKNHNTMSRTSLKQPYDDFYSQGKYFEFLIGLKCISEELLKPQHFICLEYSLKNDRGSDISGGERAEYLLSNEISQSSKFDFLLIDEPEASFDNIFLNESIKKMIKDISLNTTTFVTTHNNSLGAELMPKKIIYTEFKEGNYNVYSGKFGCENLSDKNGAEIPCSKVVYDTLESGKEKYKNRREIYENLEN